jgi:hypothetical protein
MNNLIQFPTDLCIGIHYTYLLRAVQMEIELTEYRLEVSCNPVDYRRKSDHLLLVLQSFC